MRTVLSRLIALLYPPRADERLLEHLPYGALTKRIAPVTVYATRPRTIAILPFHDETVRAAIHEAKYHGSERAFALLSAALTAYLGSRSLDTARTRIVPVPLGNRRRRERGYNQVEEVARRAAATLGLSLDTELLVRTRETESQVSLPRAKRLENMRGAFRIAEDAAHPPDPAYLYIVLDDVTTTGATLSAALDALTEAGVRKLLPIALAH